MTHIDVQGKMVTRENQANDGFASQFYFCIQERKDWLAGCSTTSKALLYRFVMKTFYLSQWQRFIFVRYWTSLQVPNVALPDPIKYHLKTAKLLDFRVRYFSYLFWFIAFLVQILLWLIWVVDWIWPSLHSSLMIEALGATLLAFGSTLTYLT